MRNRERSACGYYGLAGAYATTMRFACQTCDLRASVTDSSLDTSSAVLRSAVRNWRQISTIDADAPRLGIATSELSLFRRPALRLAHDEVAEHLDARHCLQLFRIHKVRIELN